MSLKLKFVIYEQQNRKIKCQIIEQSNNIIVLTHFNNQHCRDSKSRFYELVYLKQQNKSLKDRLQLAQTEIQELDEFKVAMYYRKPNKMSIFNQLEKNIEDKRKIEVQKKEENSKEEKHDYPKQINILKAQVIKQQRYIKRLTQILQEQRYFYSELKSYMKYFSQVLFRSQMNQQLYDIPADYNIYNTNRMSIIEQSSPIKVNQNKPQFEDSFDVKLRGSSPRKTVINPKELMEQVEQKQQYVSLKNLLKMFKSNEEKDNFINLFNQAYSKVIDFENKNQEFNSMFELTRGQPFIRQINDKPNLNARKSTQIIQIANEEIKSGEWYLRYTHPIKKFIHKFGKYFPVRTIFQAFPMREREQLESMMNALEGMSNSISVNLRKLDTFSLFKSNPYYFHDSQVHQKGDVKKELSIPMKIIEERWVLEIIQNQNFLQNQTTLPVLSLNQLSQTSTSLSELLNELLKLQKEVTNNYDLRYKIVKAVESLLTLGVMVGDANGAQTNVQIVMDEVQKNQPYSNLQKENQSNEQTNYAFFYNKSFHSHNEFGQKFTLLETLVEDLYVQITTNDKSLVLWMRKIQNLLRNIKYSYDLQYNLSRLRETEIGFLKQKLDFYQEDVENLKDFVMKVQHNVNDFFQNIDEKLNNLSQSFQQQFEDKLDDKKQRRQAQMHYKQTLKEIQQWIRRYKNQELKDNSVNLKIISQSFDQKINFLFTKFQTIEKNMQNIMTDVTK